MTSDKVWFATGVAVLVVLLVVALSTLVGAVFLWALSVFGIVQFSWLKALALGMALTILKSVFNGD